MSEGANFSWKVQKVTMAPSLSYDSLYKPLKAPTGKRWDYNPKTKEWSLVDIETVELAPVVVLATAIDVDSSSPLGVFDSGAVAQEAASPLTQDEVVDLLLRESKGMKRSEARAYLMLGDWDFAQALETAREDGF